MIDQHSQYCLRVVFGIGPILDNLRLTHVVAALAVASCVTLPMTARVIPPGQKPNIRLARQVTYDSSGFYAISTAIADFNGDSKPDLVVANECEDTSTCPGEVAVLLGNGDGTFQSAMTYSTGAHVADSVAAGDVNGDGKPDLVVANECLSLNPQGNCTGISVVSVLFGNGDGTFQSAVTYSTDSYGALFVVIGDLRGKGVLDLVVANGCSNNCVSGTASVLLGNGDGTFQAAVNYGSGDSYAESVAVADLNRDGIPDLVLANLCSANGGCEPDGGDADVGVLLGNGDGTFRPAKIYDSGGRFTYSVTVGDFRGNGILDLAAASGFVQNSVSVLLGNGKGKFNSPVTYELRDWAYDAVVVGDIDGDGNLDLVVVDECEHVRVKSCVGTGKVSVLLGNGDGTFQAAIRYDSGGYGGSAIAVGDVNGDGRPDIVVTNLCGPDKSCVSHGTVAVLLNKTTYKTTTALTSSPNPSHVNQSVTFTATITSTPAAPDGETVTFYNGKTNLGTGTTKNGVATLTTSFAKADTYTIKATYSGDPFRKKSTGTVKQVVNP